MRESEVRRLVAKIQEEAEYVDRLCAGGLPRDLQQLKCTIEALKRMAGDVDALKLQAEVHALPSIPKA